MNRKRSLLLVLTVTVVLIAGIVLGHIFTAKTVLAQEKETEKKEERPFFARLTIVQMKKVMIDDAAKLYKGSVVPAARSQEGYIGAYFLVDRKTGKGVSITAWETEKNAIANEESGYYQEQVGKFKDIFTEASVREGYEVVVSDVKTQPKE